MSDLHWVSCHNLSEWVNPIKSTGTVYQNECPILSHLARFIRMSDPHWVNWHSLSEWVSHIESAGTVYQNEYLTHIESAGIVYQNVWPTLSQLSQFIRISVKALYSAVAIYLKWSKIILIIFDIWKMWMLFLCNDNDTWSCLSLPRPTTSSGWILLIFVKFEFKHLQILMFKQNRLKMITA